MPEDWGAKGVLYFDESDQCENEAPTQSVQVIAEPLPDAYRLPHTIRVLATTQVSESLREREEFEREREFEREFERERV